MWNIYQTWLEQRLIFKKNWISITNTDKAEFTSLEPSLSRKSGFAVFSSLAYFKGRLIGASLHGYMRKYLLRNWWTERVRRDTFKRVHLIANKFAIKIHFWFAFYDSHSSILIFSFFASEIQLPTQKRGWLSLIIFATQLNTLLI